MDFTNVAAHGRDRLLYDSRRRALARRPVLSAARARREEQTPQQTRSMEPLGRRRRIVEVDRGQRARRRVHAF